MRKSPAKLFRGSSLHQSPGDKAWIVLKAAALGGISGSTSACVSAASPVNERQNLNLQMVAWYAAARKAVSPSRVYTYPADGADRTRPGVAGSGQQRPLG